MLMTMTIAACNGAATTGTTGATTQTTEVDNDDLGFIPVTPYESIYGSMRTSPYPEIPTASVQKASHGYTLMALQGYNSWYYEIAVNGAFEDMAYESTSSRWGDQANHIAGAIQTAYGDTRVSKSFLVPASMAGGVVLSGNVRPNGTGGLFAIYINETKIYPTNDDWLEVGNDITTGYFYSIDAAVNTGDRIRFVSSDGSIETDPSVIKGELTETSLYFDFKNEQFENNMPRHIGDVHPFYHDGKLYMYYLETNGRYTSALLESADFVTYTESEIRIGSPSPTISTYFVLGITKYQDTFVSFFGASASQINSSYSTDLYEWKNHNGIGNIPATENTSARDPYVFYDPDVDRYRIVYLSYYSNNRNPGGDFDAALWLKTSTGSSPDSWESGHDELLRFDNAGVSGKEDPEVSQMVKIGTRWYLIASIYSRTVHGVGGFSYWKGDENTLITDVDWKSKTEQTLDGEDLCAGQLVQVGDRWYLFGWVPANPSSSQWGGALTLAREVYQLKNGDLAVRLDPYLANLINRGTILDLRDTAPTAVYGSVTQDAGVTAVQGGSEARYGFDVYGEARLPGTYGRVIVDYRLDLSDGTSRAGLLLKNTDTAVRHFVYVDRTSSLLLIYSRTPEGNSIRASTRIAVEDWSDLKIKVIVDGSIVDVFLNDTYSLVGRVTTTGLNELDQCQISLFVSGVAAFRDVIVSKLAAKEDFS